MRAFRYALCSGFVVMVLSTMICAGTPGSFRGMIVESQQTAADPNWIYVQSRNGMIRRVEISHADVEYDESVPASNRMRTPAEALKPGAEVRVTAEQGSDGEWRASRVEILKAAAGNQRSALKGLSGADTGCYTSFPYIEV